MTDPIVERRASIPVHILKHMDEHLDGYATRMEKLFLDHRREEMDRYEEILSLIKTSNENHAARHTSLLQLVTEHMQTTDTLNDHLTIAFPLDKRGKPDYVGHAEAHENWKEAARDTKEMKAYVMKVSLAAAVIAVGGWLMALAWAGALRGPV